MPLIFKHVFFFKYENHNHSWYFSDLGLEIAKDMANRGARIIMACKNMSKGIKIVKK